MATERLEIRIDEKGALVASRNIEQIGKSAAGAGGALKLLKGALGAIAVSVITREFVRLSSTWTDLQSRILNVTKSASLADVVTTRLTEAARRAYAPFESMAEIFLRSASSLTELGISTRDQLDFTEAMTNALVISGAKGERSETVINALTKAMSLGKLSGQNWNTVLEQGGRIVDALAAGTGKSIRGLREAASAGQLTTETVFTALLSQAEQLRTEADAMPATINDALVIMRNKVMRFVGDLDKELSISGSIVKGMDAVSDALSAGLRPAVRVLTGVATAAAFLANHMSELATAAKVLTVFLTLLFSQQLIGRGALLLETLTGALATSTAGMNAMSTGSIPRLITAVKALGVAFKALFAQLLANPLVAIGAALVALEVLAFDRLNKKISESERAEQKLYETKLRALQAKRKVIQQTKLETASIDDTLKALREENNLLRLSEKTRQIKVAIMKAEKDAGRGLTSGESLLIRALIDERFAIEASKDALKERADALGAIKGPQIEFDNQMKIHNELLASGKINAEEFALATARLREELTNSTKAPEIAKPEAANPATTSIDSLTRENMLLKMNSQERAVQNELFRVQDELRAQEKDLTPGQAKEIELLVRQNMELQLQAQLYDEITGPAERYALSLAALNKLASDGKISAEELRLKTSELKEEFDKGPGGDGRGLQVLSSVFDNALNGLNDLSQTWRGFVVGFLSDVARMLQQQIILNIAGKLKGAGVPGFAHGTSFMVGGQGGVDNNPILFNASRGERVTVETPAQQRSQAIPSVAAPMVNLKIVNVTDPKEILEQMKSAEGEEVVLNIISRNATTIRQGIA